MFVECPFCHKRILKILYSSHVQKHTRLKDDGQMEDHISMPESERYAGSLAGIPRSYYHPKCGVQTGMPEFIIRSYLANPYLYNDFTFCGGCGDYVHHSEVFWVETNESLLDYHARLRNEFGPPPEKKMEEHYEIKQGVSLSFAAGNAIRKILDRGTFPVDAVVRVLVNRNLTTGTNYELEIENGPQPNDALYMSERVKLVVDRSLVDFLRGTVIDYEVSQEGRAGFRFSNPNDV